MGDSLKVFDYVKKYLPLDVVKTLDNLNSSQQQGITEIRIRRNMPVTFVIDNRIKFADRFCQTLAVLPKEPLIISSQEFDDMFNRLCSYSVYSNMTNLKNGYITLENGSRVGVCSTAVYEDDNLVSVKDVTSVNIRIPRQAVGCSRDIVSKTFANGVCSVIVAGKPSSGKTTLLRDMARQISNGINGTYKKVVVIDERNELAGKVGDEFTLDVGMNTDVITGFDKPTAIENAIRTMSPQVIVCDEISAPRELDSIRFGFACGVNYLLSVHIGKQQDLYTKPIVRLMLSMGEFEKLILLDEDYSAKILDAREILNEIHRRSNNSCVIIDDGNIYE